MVVTKRRFFVESVCNLHQGEVRGDALRPPHEN